MQYEGDSSINVQPVGIENIKLTDVELETSFYGHLGLISEYFNELGLRELLDSLMPKTRAHKVTHGDAVLAFVLNGLSFRRRQLYLFPKFFENLPVSRLFDKDIASGDLNEAVMGELPDRIYDFGPTELYQLVMQHILKRENFDLKNLHADTTNFSVWGDFETGYENVPPGEEPDEPAFEINIGHPKDGRWDLKRFTLGLISSSEGIPLFMKTYSGSASDHQTLKDAMLQIQEGLRESLPEECYFIADAAFYTEPNISDFKMHWISRVPATIKEASALMRSDASMEQGVFDDRYSFCELSSEYGGVSQKWVLVYSSEMSRKTGQTFEKRLAKQIDSADKALPRLQNLEFACEPDALSHARKWIEKYPLLEFENLSVEAGKRKESGRKGRPRKDEVLKDVYCIRASLRENEEAIRAERRSLGRFILASNDVSLSGEKMLEIYKEQGSVERGFRFLKNKSFLVSETYLKKPSRIEALAFIMVLCLSIYSLLELKLRRGLSEKKLTIPDSLRKPTSKPTLQWAFSFFERITEGKFLLRGSETVVKVALTHVSKSDVIATILTALGKRYENIYLDGDY